MVTYRKCWTLMGHSIGEGTAGQSPLINDYPHFAQLGGATGGAVNQAYARKFPGLKMFVTANPWPSPWPWLSPAQSPHVSPTWPSPAGDDRGDGTAIGTGAWLDMTLDLASSPGDQTHPYYSPAPASYMIPSGRTIPFPPNEYNADGTGASGLLASSGGGSVTGVELPLSYNLAAYWGEAVYGVKLAIPSTTLMREEDGDISYASYYGKRGAIGLNNDTGKYFYSWFSPFDNFDFDSTSGRLYTSMIDKMTGAAAALPSGEKLDVRLSIMWLGDNDAGKESTPRIDNWKEVYLSLINNWRQALVDNAWTRLPKEQIPIVIMGIYVDYGTTPIRETMNTDLQAIADADPYITYISTLAYESLATAGFTDNSHISHNGYVVAADDIVTAMRAMETAQLDAMDTTDLVDVDEVRTRVRAFYENNRVRTGTTSDAVLLTHINGALTHIHNRMSDQAYWLRKRETINVTAAVGAVQELDSKVHRVLRIEDQNDPARYLRFREIGRANGGKLQVQLTERANGNYVFHYIEIPKELTKGAQKVPLPRVALEWLVTEVARRVARSNDNVQMTVSLQKEATMLHEDVAKHAAAMTRKREDRLHQQRQLRGRIGAQYGRFRPWLRL